MHITLCHLVTRQEHQHAWLPAPDPGTQDLAAHCQTPLTRLEPLPKFVPSDWTCLLPTTPTGLPPLACSSPPTHGWFQVRTLRGGSSSWASLVTQPIDNPPAMQETTIWFLGQADPLEKG